jgi:hypothetical protein
VNPVLLSPAISKGIFFFHSLQTTKMPVHMKLEDLYKLHTYYPNIKIYLTAGDKIILDCVWNVMAHTRKPDLAFRRNGRVHLNRSVWGGGQFSRLLAGEPYASACRVCTARARPCSAVMWRLPVTHSIVLFPLRFSDRASPWAVTFQTQSTIIARRLNWKVTTNNRQFTLLTAMQVCTLKKN